MSGHPPRCVGREVSRCSRQAMSAAQEPLILTRLILWKPYMFSCRTKLENCADAEMTVRSGAQREETETLHVVVLEVGAEDGAAELADVGHHKAGRADGRSVGTRCGEDGHGQAGTHLVPSSVQLMNWEDFGSLIILWDIRHRGERTGEWREHRTEKNAR